MDVQNQTDKGMAFHVQGHYGHPNFSVQLTRDTWLPASDVLAPMLLGGRSRSDLCTFQGGLDKKSMLQVAVALKVASCPGDFA